MGRSQETFNKKEIRNKKEKKRLEKEKKRLARKDTDKAQGLDEMIAYVDENGMITDTPPDLQKKTKINAKDIEIGIPKRDAVQSHDPVRRGTVTFFNDSKGYGFIRDLESKQSIFVHANNLLEDVKENNLVSFEIVKAQKGPTAVQVRIYKEEKVVPPAVKVEVESAVNTETAPETTAEASAEETPLTKTEANPED